MAPVRSLAPVLALTLVTVTCGADDTRARDDAGPPTTTPATTSTSPTAPTSTSTTSTAPSTTTASPTTTAAPDTTCEPSAALTRVDADLDRAGLADGSSWPVVQSTRFDDRTVDADEFRDRLFLDCSVRIATGSPEGAERLTLVAWTGPRVVHFVQASDTPVEPITGDVTFWLLTETVEGRWLDVSAAWAGTLAGGETVVMGAVDYSLAAVAKAWPTGFPPPPAASATLDSQRHATAVLAKVGARGIGVAEPPEFGSEVGTLQFVTREGLIALATVGPTGWFDPMQAWLSGPTTTLTVDGVEVRVTGAGPGEFDVADVGWSCPGEGFVWRLDSAFGTPDELAALAGLLVQVSEC